MGGLKNDTQPVSMDRRSSSFFARIALVVTAILGFGVVTVSPNTFEAQVSDSTSYLSPSETAGAPADASPDANAAASSVVEETTHQETSASLDYSGAWSSAEHPGYLGGRAHWSTEKGASASIAFTGIGISWIGPVGPTRGKARIYVDGRYVKTIDAYEPNFDPSRVLFSTTYATEKTRTLEIVVVGTQGPSDDRHRCADRPQPGYRCGRGTPAAGARAFTHADPRPNP